MTDVASLNPTPTDDVPLPHGGTCTQCGAPIEADDRFCVACGTPIESTKRGAATPTAETAQKHFRCQNCAAEVAADPDQRSFTCPFCESTYVVEYAPDETGRQRPEFVIGFAFTPEQAAQRFKQWLDTNSWFRPGDLAQAQIVDKLRGVYLPFWSFSMLAESEWSASIGEYWYRTETYTTMQNGKLVTKTRRVRMTEWWPLAGRHHRYYSGYLITGSRGLKQADAERIKPFHLAGLKRYEPYFLAGWLSEEYSIDRDAALKHCQDEFYSRERNNVAAFLPGDEHSDLSVRTQFSEVNSDLILLPVYILTYRYAGKRYQFLLNGQTGKVAGDKPLSWRRIAAAVAIGLTLVAAAALAIMYLAR